MSAHALPDRRQLAEGLDAVGADAWLLFDFHGLNPVAEVRAAVADAGKRLECAGWVVEEVETPPLREAAELQTKLLRFLEVDHTLRLLD